MKQVRAKDLEPQREHSTSVLLREDRGQVTLLTLNRPETRNCLSEDMIAAVHAAIGEIAGSDAVRAIVITGAGSAFSSGHDLKEMTAHRSDPDRGRAYFAKIMNACSQMMLAIVRSPKPVIVCQARGAPADPTWARNRSVDRQTPRSARGGETVLSGTIRPNAASITRTSSHMRTVQ